jgi:predicted alpha/beta-fold hydrolase
LRWDYQAPFWLPDGHTQTIYSSVCLNKLQSNKAWTRERVLTPDRDFIDIDWALTRNQTQQLCIMFHGLEGNSSSHYCTAFQKNFNQSEIGICVPHFRGCSGEINLGPRAYHSGDFEEIDWIIKYIKEKFEGELWAVGVSLGGNALLRWAQESGQAAGHLLKGMVSICAPLDLSASGHKIGMGLNHFIYEKRFLKTMKQKARDKYAQYPKLFDIDRVEKSRSLYEFDDAFTAPVHGFKNVDEYWNACSSKRELRKICIPHWVINAENDPFVPSFSLPTQKDFNSMGSFILTVTGGHVGYASGAYPGNLEALPNLLKKWMQ